MVCIFFITTNQTGVFINTDFVMITTDFIATCVHDT